MPVPYIKVLIGFTSLPDDPEQVWTDVSEYVRAWATPITLARGRDDELGVAEPKQLRVALTNDGRFSFGVAAGAYYPNVVPGKRIRVLVSPDGTTWYARFDGYITGWPAAWAGVNATDGFVLVTAVDRLSRLSEKRKLRDALLEEAGSASDVEEGWWLASVADPPGTGGDPAEPDMPRYPGSTSFPATTHYPFGG